MDIKMDINTELWKTIEGFPNYQISNLGNVRNIKTLKHLAPNPNGGGYLRVRIKNTEGKLTDLSINRLVAFAFLGNPPQNKNIVNHINHKKTDNKLSNLEWVSAKQNVLHSLDLPRKKFKRNDILTIREMAEQGISAGMIARKYKKPVTTISNIIKLLSHKNVA
jgi:hypothetical protein